jgi:endonuclease/exonuclease/phosphatase family metal-dependent hydrolase
MEMVVWNSQGGKWDTLYDTGLKGPVGSLQNVFGLVVESGWAPWVVADGIQLDSIYYLKEDLTYYDKKKAEKSALAKAFLDYSEQGIRGQQAFWVPWMKTKDPISVNTRCSIGGVYFPQPGKNYTVEVQVRTIKAMTRPAVQLTISRGKMTLITVYLVHFAANDYKAGKELEYLTSVISTIVPQGTPAVVLGDINVNILNTPTANVSLARNWYLIRTDQATHTGSHGLSELDYCLLYDPNRNNQGITVSQVAQFKSPTNPSDHSMLRYSFTGSQW